MSYSCKKCNSEDVRRLSIIHSEGLSKINATTSGSAVSAGGGLRIGSGTAKTSGTIQTDLSKKAAPPEKNSYVGTIIVWFIGALILMWLLGWLGINVSGADMKGKIYEYGSFLVLAWLLCKVWIYNRENYPPLRAKWDNSFMCFRCGEVFEVKGNENEG